MKESQGKVRKMDVRSRVRVFGLFDFKINVI